METQEQDLLTQAQEGAIRTQIAEDQPLVGALELPAVLLPEYQGNPKAGFVKGVNDLAARYRNLRRVRGDGNCFYRAFLFSFLEWVLEGLAAGGARGDQAKKELTRVRAIIRESKDRLVALQYSSIAIECFWETFLEELEAFDAPAKTPAQLEEDFREEHGAQASLVWYCRLLTSGYLKENADRFLPFLSCEGDMASFCAREVEPMGKECEQVQILALCEQLGVPLAIEYLDGEDFGEHLSRIKLPETDQPAIIHLLYRPGHYDVLYPK